MGSAISWLTAPDAAPCIFLLAPLSGISLASARTPSLSLGSLSITNMAIIIRTSSGTLARAAFNCSGRGPVGPSVGLVSIFSFFLKRPQQKKTFFLAREDQAFRVKTTPG
jgi:hypothetical protein